MLFDFNPSNNFSKQAGIFGLPFAYDNARLILIPICWDVTTSYREGSALAPENILDASYQLDLYDPIWGNVWEKGIYLMEIDEEISDVNSIERRKARSIIDFFENEEGELPPRLKKALKEVNDACDQTNSYVFQKVKKVFEDNKIPALVGGDHSISFSSISFLSSHYQNFGILQFDAHADLRKAYMGFSHSHASVMRNVLENNSGIKKLVQVGIRDLCQEEMDFIQTHDEIKTFFMKKIRYEQFTGKTWHVIAQEIVDQLPENIYISFDIDGLDATLCPHTGTPVPGGLLYDEVTYLLDTIVKQGKTIVGFDLVETGYDPINHWDEIVSCRLLYQLCLATLASQKN
ncbi:MAG: agmatinase family protein [Bacteroidales bacterium]|nr:agmatinase family protein [Bacteroidales bacterium]